jgi:hypothetical protein
MRLRRTVVAALLAAGVAVPVAATAGFAAAPAASSTATAAHKGDSKPGKVRAKFAASGRVTAVDAVAGTVTVAAKGGTKDVRKRTVTVSVADDARVRINGKRAALDAVVVGAKISVTGDRVNGVYTATRVQVSQKSRPVVQPSPTPTVSPSPDVDPTEEPEDETSDDLSA